MPSEPFDHRTARRGIDSLIIAYGRWDQFRAPILHRSRPTRAVVEESALQASVLITEIARWVRAVDEYLSEVRNKDNEGLLGYDDAVSRDETVLGILDGLAHAADKSLHRLVDPKWTLMTSAITRGSIDVHGLETRRNDARYIWQELPASSSRKPRPRELAKSGGYARFLAHHEVDPVLVVAVSFLRGQLS